MYGYDFAEETKLTSKKFPLEHWAMAQGFGTCISFNILMMILFRLSGFQQMMLICIDSCIDFDRRGSKKEKLKKTLKEALEPESMNRVHSVIIYTLCLLIILHIFENFVAWENSGPSRQYIDVFGTAPFWTGGISFVLFSIIMSSGWIDPKRNPRAFRHLHRLSFLLFIFLLFHGKNLWNPNFWKYLIVPFVLFSMDKMFRLGVFGFRPQTDVVFAFGDQGKLAPVNTFDQDNDPLPEQESVVPGATRKAKPPPLPKRY